MKKLLIFTLFVAIIFAFSEGFTQGKRTVSASDGDSLLLSLTLPTANTGQQIQKIDGYTNEYQAVPGDSGLVRVWQDSTGQTHTAGDSIRSRIVVDYYRSNSYVDLMATDTLTAHAVGGKDFEWNKTWTRFYFTPRARYEFFIIRYVPQYGLDTSGPLPLSGTEKMLFKWQITFLQYYDP